MSWIKSIKEKLVKTSNGFTQGIAKIFNGKRKLDAKTLEEFEEMLLMSDIGHHIASEFVQKLKEKKFNSEVTNEDIKTFLKQEAYEIIKDYSKDFYQDFTTKKPVVIMLCGVNGNGKTTTAGKLGMQFYNKGLKVVFGACDTFRSAAVEQLQEWGKKVNAQVVIGENNSDAASVGYRALQTTINDQADVLILDTAGRLHNKVDLMNELNKCTRVLKKLNENAPHEIIMVVDSTTGQNVYSQIETFQKTVPITGLIFTKLDSTAKGGIIIGVTKKYQLPIYAIGIGEGINDLRHLDCEEFVNAIL